MKNIYEDGKYLKNNPTWHSEDSAWKAGKIQQILISNNIQFQKLTEIGCGAGQVLGCLSRHYRNNQFEGYEISPQAYELTQKIKQKNIKFYLSDFFESNHENTDLAMAIDVFEHVQNPYLFLKDLKDKANYFVFHIPLSANGLNILKNGFINEKKQWGHIHYYCKDTAIEILKDSGYKILDFEYTNFAFELETSLKGIPMNVFRRLINIFSKDFSVRALGGSSLLVLAQKT